MRSVLALMRASFLSAASYRIGMVLSVVALLASVVPLYFVSGALQPVVEKSIQLEGGQYFGFVVVGIAATLLLASAVAAVPGALGSTISNGVLEALLVTRTPLLQVLVGVTCYGLVWSALRAAVMVAGAAALGAQVNVTAVPIALLILLLMVGAYYAIGLCAGALVLVYRTSGPLVSGTIAVSGLLGGVYYSTTVIPSWLQHVSAVIPLSYALRPIRMLLLGNAPFLEALPDILVLALFALGLLMTGVVAFTAALRRARLAGTLSQY